MAPSFQQPADPPPFEVPAQWAWHYRTLRETRERLLGARAQRARELSDASAGSVEPGDFVSDRAGEEQAAALLAAEERTLAEVDAALDRLRRGVYGRCEATGRDIPAARLRALPWCRTAMPLREKRGRKGGSSA